jgi:hypothetical protein
VMAAKTNTSAHKVSFITPPSSWKASSPWF